MADASSSFIGVPGLPGASTNSNPLSSSFLGGLVTATPTQNWSLDNLISGTTPAPATSSANAGTVAGSIANTGSGISDLFLRGVIIILGFIFVAVGLSMFKTPTVITETMEGVKRAGSTARKVVGK